MQSRFGFKNLDVRTEVDDLLKNFIKVDSISANLLMREAYEISYGIYDHDRDDTHPWSLVLHSIKEDYSTYSPLYNAFYRYRLRNIEKRWGLSVTEFLELPREFVELIFEISKEEDLEEDRTYRDVKDSVEGKT